MAVVAPASPSYRTGTRPAVRLCSTRPVQPGAVASRPTQQTMKILDIPQSGKRGLNVSQNGRYGQISRALVIPANPRTAAQERVRAILATTAAAWRALTEAQRAAWTGAALTQMSKSRCGQSGPLTGSQLYNKVNCTLVLMGADAVDTPPAKAALPAIAPENLVITNPGNVAVLKLTCPDDPGDYTILRACAPVSAGRSKPGSMVIIGVCPAPVGGSATITGLYTARFGNPPEASKVFVSAATMVNGYESPQSLFMGIVPAAA